MITSREEIQILKEVLRGLDFYDSERYKELLQYLAEAALVGNIP